MDERTSKVEYYSALKKKGNFVHGTRQMKLEDIRQSESTQMTYLK